MDNTKVCKHCNVEKDINDFAMYKNREGIKVHRNVCKTCQNRQQNKSRGHSAENKNISPEIENKTIENKEKEYKSMDIFNDNEIAILKQIIKEYNSVNTDITIEKGQRIRKTYNIDEVLSKKILQEARKQGITASDILNIAVKKYFFNV